MTQYIDKAALVAEIEKMRDKAYPQSDWNHGYTTSCEKILSFLDTLEMKEVGLNEEIESYFKGFGKFPSVGIDDCIDIAKHFYELGLKQNDIH